MESNLSAQFVENLYNSVISTAPTVKDVRQSFQQALTSLLESASILAFFKETEGRNFGNFATENDISVLHANKLIGLLGEFGEYYQDVQNINPLTLTSMLGAAHSEAREVLPERIKECQKNNEELVCADITALKKAHAKPKPQGIAKLVGNQQGGTAIFRAEIKDPVLASELDSSFKESGLPTPNKFFGFLNESSKTIREISEIVLGRRIQDIDEIAELKIAVVNKLQSSDVVEEVAVPILKESTDVKAAPVVEVVQSVEPCVVHSKWRPLVELVQQNNSLIGLKAVVAESVGVIGEKLQNIFSLVKGKSCVIQNEPIVSSSLDEAHIWVRFDDFGAKIVPLSWLQELSAV